MASRSSPAVQSVPRIARAAGIETPDQPYVPVASGLLSRAAETHGDDPRYAELLDRYAERVATGLASIVAVLDPELIVLSGDVLVAGGEPLRARVQSELAELAASRPRLVLAAVPRQPVLRGALESALATTRDEVFDTSR